MVYPHKWSPSATGRVQDRESSPAKDRRSTAVPRDQHTLTDACFQHDSLWCAGFPENLAFAEFRHRYEILASASSRPSGPLVDERQVGIRRQFVLFVSRIHLELLN